MAVGAILATALMGTGSPPATLTLGSVDVMLVPGTSGTRAGTPIESVHVTEAGPGGVSTMEFVIEDPLLTISISNDMIVLFQTGANRVEFLGWVQSWGVEPAFGDTGRIIRVQATGVEALLDWAKINTDVVFAVGAITDIGAAVQTLAAQSVGIGPLRAFKSSTGDPSNQERPIAGNWAVTSNATALTIPIGTTLREAIRMMVASVGGQVLVSAASGATGVLSTVDFTYGLRVWSDGVDGTSDTPQDYANIAFNDSPGSANYAESLSYDVDAQGTPAGVIVRWAAGTVILANSPPRTGDYAYLTDTSLADAAAGRAAAVTYLAQFKSAVRGSLAKTDYAPGFTVHAGGFVTIIDARAGLTGSEGFRVMQIEKTYNPSSRPNYTFSFGGLPPSGARLIRRLTRATLS